VPSHPGIVGVTNSLELTFDYLATTENEAATRVLMGALDHADAAIAHGALRALLRRKSPEALRELVARWHRIGEGWKEIVAERPGLLTAALKQAFHSSEEQLIRNAVAAAVETADYDFVAIFAAAVGESHVLRRSLSAQAMLSLADALYEELHGHARVRVRRDMQLVRQFVAGSLESPVARFPQHRATAVLEAFLLVATRENATLRHMLQDLRDPSHEAVTQQLTHSTRPGVMRLLLSMLDDARAPLAVLRIVGRRSDAPFFRLLCKKLSEDHSPPLVPNLGRIDSLGWLAESLSLLETLDDDEQVGAATLVWRGRIDNRQKRRILQHLLRTGQPRGRQAAARALLELLGPEGHSLTMSLLHDDCPLVQAEAVRHLRARDIPNAMSLLIGLLDSPHEEVRAAASGSLEEFTFARYLSAFDTLSPEARKSTGSIVKRANPNVAEELLNELLSSGRARRLRAMQIAEALDLVPEMEFGLIELCRDEDHVVRTEAARMLGLCWSQEARRTLRDLLSDPRQTVQFAAEQSLEDMAEDPLEGLESFDSPMDDTWFSEDFREVPQ
jgi:HEAT repeat protein